MKGGAGAGGPTREAKTDEAAPSPTTMTIGLRGGGRARRVRREQTGYGAGAARLSVGEGRGSERREERGKEYGSVMNPERNVLRHVWC